MAADRTDDAPQGSTRRKQGNRVPGLPAYVVAFCVAVFALVLALLNRNGAGDDSAAIGFPIVLAGIAVAATLFALAWRSLMRRHR